MDTDLKKKSKMKKKKKMEKKRLQIRICTKIWKLFCFLFWSSKTMLIKTKTQKKIFIFVGSSVSVCRHISFPRQIVGKIIFLFILTFKFSFDGGGWGSQLHEVEKSSLYTHTHAHSPAHTHKQTNNWKPGGSQELSLVVSALLVNPTLRHTY